MKLRGSHLVALAILAAVGGWMLTGDLIEGGKGNPDAQSIAEREEKREQTAFRVRVTEIQPTQREAKLEVRGRTEASATVTVRAETGGTVERVSFTKGQRIERGDVLCVLDQGVRASNLAQAEAALEQAQADYDANVQLAERGFATQSKLRSLRAALNAAKAALASAKQEMGRTEVLATAAGQLQEPYAEQGDNLSPGQVCATLTQLDPMLFSGQVPEREVGAIRPGMKAAVEVVSGGKVEGTIRYISPQADARTRTFEVEIEIPNENSQLRDGMTATATIALAPIEAYKLAQNWITLNDEGEVGVRVVDENRTVRFLPVVILAQESDGIWVTGLSPGLNVITLGQNYVAAGETVEPVDAGAIGEQPNSEGQAQS